MDTAKFQQDPCSLLGQDQLEKIGIHVQGKPVPDSPTGPACRWSDQTGESGFTASASIATNNPAGLSFLYRTKKSFKEFREYPPVEGYPAVAPLSVSEQSGMCTLDVGVSDKQFVSFIIQGDAHQKPKPCDRAKQVAGEVVKTLKQAQA